MIATFPVNWQQLFKSLTIFISVAIDAPLMLSIAIVFIWTGFNYSRTIGHASLNDFLLLFFVYVPFFSGIISFLISQFLRISIITLSDGNIAGRNYWGLKNTIPLYDVTEVTRFGNHGINWIVVNSKNHGKIYILEHTERLHELLDLLTPYLKQIARVEQSKPRR